MKHLLGSNGRGHRIDRIALTKCPAIYTSLLSYISNWTARRGDGAGKKNAGRSDVGAHPGLGIRLRLVIKLSSFCCGLQQHDVMTLLFKVTLFLNLAFSSF